ncbi:hypothetical protein PRUPE_4G264700 [Prunus persica]|uniref:Gnk2-homologous domain-containing protein n=1 Tax=Prunus persica TaxID=3760 RepID=A0A251PRD8_PRUPE|nr:hypothetical protein PRUPE_4G264700 [Prunus persica]
MSSKVVNNPKLIQDKVHALLTRLSFKAINGPLYANGKIKISPKGKNVFGTVECTKDLSEVNCKECLDVAITELQDRSYGMRGGHVFYGSCYIRFEFHRFYY